MLKGATQLRVGPVFASNSSSNGASKVPYSQQLILHNASTTSAVVEYIPLKQP
jgi:hypothetical protein